MNFNIRMRSLFVKIKGLCPEGFQSKCICAKHRVKVRMTMKVRLKYKNMKPFSLQRRSVLSKCLWGFVWPSVSCFVGTSLCKPSMSATYKLILETRFQFPNLRKQSFIDVSLTVWRLKNAPNLSIHFSEQTIYCCLLNPVSSNDPRHSLREMLQLKWSIVFCGPCPNDWGRFLRHL